MDITQTRKYLFTNEITGEEFIGTVGQIWRHSGKVTTLEEFKELGISKHWVIAPKNSQVEEQTDTSTCHNMLSVSPLDLIIELRERLTSQIESATNELVIAHYLECSAKLFDEELAYISDVKKVTTAANLRRINSTKILTAKAALTETQKEIVEQHEVLAEAKTVESADRQEKLDKVAGYRPDSVLFAWARGKVLGTDMSDTEKAQFEAAENSLPALSLEIIPIEDILDQENGEPKLYINHYEKGKIHDLAYDLTRKKKVYESCKLLRKLQDLSTYNQVPQEIVDYYKPHWEALRDNLRSLNETNAGLPANWQEMHAEQQTTLKAIYVAFKAKLESEYSFDNLIEIYSYYTKLFCNPYNPNARQIDFKGLKTYIEWSQEVYALDEDGEVVTIKSTKRAWSDKQQTYEMVQF